MKRARIIVLAIAIVSALGAAFLAKSFLGNTRIIQTVRTQYDTVRVLVARGAIGVGTAVNKNDLKWQQWPKNAATAGYITQNRKPKAISELSGAMARASFLPGEPIASRKLNQRLIRQNWFSRLYHDETGVPYGIALAAAALIIYPQTLWITPLL